MKTHFVFIWICCLTDRFVALFLSLIDSTTVVYIVSAMQFFKARPFSLNLKTKKVIDFLESEKVKSGISKNAYLNKLLEVLREFPIILSPPNSSMLDEIEAIKKMLCDDVAKQVSVLAAPSRRGPIQMLLHLAEKGTRLGEQPSVLECVAANERINNEKTLAMQSQVGILDRSAFNLTLRSAEVVDFLESERRKAGLSKTAYLNKLIQILSDFPVVFSGKRGFVLNEITAIRCLMIDDFMQRVPHFAAATRREPVQMFLYLVEKGIAAEGEPIIKNTAIRRSGLAGSVNRKDNAA